MNVLVIKKVIAITSVVKLYSARRDDVIVHLNNFTSILKSSSLPLYKFTADKSIES